MVDKSFTPKQMLVSKWLSELGFMLELEVPVANRIIDIWIPELNWAVEIDGPQHYKKERLKRDKELRKEGIKIIVHAPVDISETEFKSKFNALLEKKLENRIK
jgi:very-short-patch-repair endonuclease